MGSVEKLFTILLVFLLCAFHFRILVAIISMVAGFSLDILGFQFESEMLQTACAKGTAPNLKHCWYTWKTFVLKI